MAVEHLSDNQLQAYLDNSPQIHRDIIEDHLNNCTTCQNNLRAYREVYYFLKEEKADALSPSFTRDVTARIRPKPAKRWQQIETILLGVLSFCGLIITFYYINPLPLLLNFAESLISTVFTSMQAMIVTLNGNLPLLLIALIIVVLVEILDKKIIRPRL